MSAVMAEKEYALFKCAQMILLDQCPPERKHYLCMEAEDDSAVDCTQCWDRYLWGDRCGRYEASERGAEGSSMNRAEIIDRIVDMLEKIASTDNLARIYRFVKYIYIHREVEA